MQHVTSPYVMLRQVILSHVMSEDPGFDLLLPVSLTFCRRLQRAPVRRSHPADTCTGS